MIRLSRSLEAWGRPEFKGVLKEELERVDAGQLPLQQGLSASSYVTDGGFEVMIISTADEAERIRVKAGIFYAGIIPGCACANDPTPEDEYPEYCEVQLDIDKATAAAQVALLR